MLHIRRRGKNFHVRGTIRVGRQTRYVKEHSTGCHTREDAETYRARLEAEIRHELLYGTGGRTQRLTIADAGLRYIDRPGGLKSYDLWRVNEINDRVGDRQIAQAAEAWADFKRARCGGLQPATVERFRATFQAMINYLAAEEGFDAPKIRRPRSERLPRKRVRYLSPIQAARLVESYAPHVQPIVTTLRYQGLRVGEVLRLEWPHVNWSTNSLFVAETKNGEPRLPGGSPIRKAHETACRRAGIADFHVHDWRHHWACWRVMSGIDPPIVPAPKYPGMYRIRRPDGSLTGMANLTRASEALVS